MIMINIPVWEMFESLEVLGEGTYGKVHKARSRKSGDHNLYAIKILKTENQQPGEQFDVPYTSLREVSILKSLDHPNIARLKQVNFDKRSFAMIFQCYTGNLRDLLKPELYARTLDPFVIRRMTKQLISALDHIHRNGYLHRDLKPENIMYDNNLNVYIGDFGLARQITQPLREYTDNVATRPYRPPELIMGETKYGIAVDVWGLGCTLYELFTGSKYLFNGSCELENWFLMVECIGFPTPQDWPELEKLVGKKFTPHKVPNIRTSPENTLSKRLEHMPKSAVNLIKQMLTLNPSRRPSCRALLEHPYLQENEVLQLN